MTVGTALRRTGTVGTQPPVLSNRIAEYWANDCSSVGDGNAVSTWPDRSGAGRDMGQIGAGLKPLYRATAGVNGQACIEFDQTDDTMTATIPATSQPFSFIQVCNVTQTPANKSIAPVYATLATGVYMATYSGASEGWSLWAGTGGNSTGVPRSTAWAFLVGFYNGTSSVLIEGATSYNKSPGTNATSTTLRLNTGGDAYGCNIAYASLVTGDVRSDANWSTFKSWVTSTYGLTT